MHDMPRTIEEGIRRCRGFQRRHDRDALIYAGLLLLLTLSFVFRGNWIAVPVVILCIGSLRRAVAAGIFLKAAVDFAEQAVAIREAALEANRIATIGAFRSLEPRGSA